MERRDHVTKDAFIKVILPLEGKLKCPGKVSWLSR